MDADRFLSAVILAGGVSLLVPGGGNAQWMNNGNPICAAAGPQGQVTGSASDRVGTIIAWQDGRALGSSGYDVWAQRVSSGAKTLWPQNGVALCTAVADQELPTSTDDGAGGALIAWQDRRTDTGDIFAQRIAADGMIPVGWPTNGIAVCTTSGSQGEPVIVSDGLGGAIIAWMDFRNSVDNDIFAQHVTASGSIAPGWPTNGLGVCVVAGNQYSAAITTDGAGGAIISWQDDRNFATLNSDIFTQRVTSAGVAAWMPNGVPVCVLADQQATPSIAPDSQGGAIIVWADTRTSSRDIFAQHVTASGVVDPAWTTNGVPLSQATFDQQNPKLEADGSGGAVAVWDDLRNGADFDIYAQRVSGAGMTLWSPDGAPVCAAANSQFASRLVSDAAGGAFMTWHDFRTGADVDIFAQHLIADGTVATGWGLDGLAVCTAGGPQSFPAIISDRPGSAIIAWTDGRLAGNTDVFVQRVTADGLVGPPVGVGRSAVGVSSPLVVCPSPARHSATIHFSVDRFGRARVEILDLSGRLVSLVVDEPSAPAGAHSIVWDGRDLVGTPVAAGVYVARTLTQAGAATQLFVVVR